MATLEPACPNCGEMMLDGRSHLTCRSRRERIASLEATVLEQADQIGGLTSELERERFDRELYKYTKNDLDTERALLHGSRRACAQLKRQLATARAETHKFRVAEKQVSDAYIRLRKKLNAFDTPYAPTPEQVYAHTETKLDALQAEVVALRDGVNAANWLLDTTGIGLTETERAKWHRLWRVFRTVRDATPSAAAVQWPAIAERVEEVLDSLLCMVNQHCQIYVRNNDNVCVVLPHLSDEKEAVTLLERMGLATKNIHGSYDLRWPQNTDEVLAALDAATVNETLTVEGDNAIPTQSERNSDAIAAEKE